MSATYILTHFWDSQEGHFSSSNTYILIYMFLEVWSEPEVFDNVNSGQNLKCLKFMPQIFLLTKLLKYS